MAKLRNRELNVSSKTLKVIGKKSIAKCKESGSKLRRHSLEERNNINKSFKLRRFRIQLERLRIPVKNQQVTEIEQNKTSDNNESLLKIFGKKCCIKLRRIQLPEICDIVDKNEENLITSSPSVCNTKTNDNRNIIETSPKINSTNLNLAGKHAVIEDILNDLSTNEPERVADCNKKKCKFFIVKKQTKKAERRKKSSTNSKNNVFEFSQESYEDFDPAADIVKNLIKQKKVRVATCAKGKSRPMIKRKIDKKYYAKKKKNKIEQPIQEEENNQNVTVLPTSPALSPVATNTTTEVISPQKQYHNKKQLIDAVRKIISTPLNSKSVSSTDNTATMANVFDISLPGSVFPVEGVSSSPWRFSKNEPTPRALHFNKNSSHLPNTTISGTLNDSNAENVPPAFVAHRQPPENERLTALRQQSNPRKGLGQRSPLKQIHAGEFFNLQKSALKLNETHKATIEEVNKYNSRPERNVNIIEVINLPTWQSFQQNNLTEVSKNTLNETQRTEEEAENDIVGLFGFKEYLADSEEKELTTINESSHNESLKNQLKALKKWQPNVERPKNNDNQTKTPKLFDEPTALQNNQKRITEMFCSTMIQAKNKATELPDFRQSGHLFKDVEADNEECSFRNDVSLSIYYYYYLYSLRCSFVLCI